MIQVQRNMSSNMLTPPGAATTLAVTSLIPRSVASSLLPFSDSSTIEELSPCVTIRAATVSRSHNYIDERFSSSSSSTSTAYTYTPPPPQFIIATTNDASSSSTLGKIHFWLHKTSPSSPTPSPTLDLRPLTHSSRFVLHPSIQLETLPTSPSSSPSWSSSLIDFVGSPTTLVQATSRSEVTYTVSSNLLAVSPLGVAVLWAGVTVSKYKICDSKKRGASGGGSGGSGSTSTVKVVDSKTTDPPPPHIAVTVPLIPGEIVLKLVTTTGYGGETYNSNNSTQTLLSTSLGRLFLLTATPPTPQTPHSTIILSHLPPSKTVAIGSPKNLRRLQVRIVLMFVFVFVLGFILGNNNVIQIFAFF